VRENPAWGGKKNKSQIRGLENTIEVGFRGKGVRKGKVKR